MELTAIYHRPESEFAFLYEEDRFFIRLRTKANDVKTVNLISGDPFAQYDTQWHRESKPMEMVATTDLYDYWFIETTEPTKRLAYAFHLIGMDDGETFYSEKGHLPVEEKYLSVTDYYFEMPYFHEVDRFKAPEWVKGTVWYQIFPDRFAKGDPAIDPDNVLPWNSKEHPGRNDFYGGDLQGIIDNLDYLQGLGINGIYLTPIFEAATNHKYDTIDYKTIDPHFGDEETFKELVEQAHNRGIRIMLDAVFNHIGYYSKEWQDVLAHQEKSIYKDWFHIHSFPVVSLADLTAGEMNRGGKLNYETFAFTGFMPKLNTANPEVQDFLLDIATYWIREFDIDGWRLDVADEVDHQFWKKFHKACLKEKEDFYILGEIWHSGQKWLEGDEFHAVMNYPLTETLESYFLEKEITPLELTHQMNEQWLHYRTQTNEVQFNLLDSHDTPRILTKAQGDQDVVKSMLTFMFAQTGAPCVYYGTEIGLDGANDPDCRKCMLWEEANQDLEMLEFMKELIHFRTAHADLLTYGTLDWHDIRNEENIIGFTRVFEGQQMTFYFNQGEQEQTVVFSKDSQPLLNHRAKTEDKQLVIQPNGFAIHFTQ